MNVQDPPRATGPLPLDGVELTVHRPGSPVIGEVRRFRGEVIWDGGRRPAFRTVDGAFVDPHPADVDSYHLVVRTTVERSMIGCVTAAPLESLSESAVVRWSPVLSARLLDERGVDESSVLEGARLVVAPGWRGRRLGLLLILGAAALGQVAGRRLTWATVGTRQNQHRLCQAAGWRERVEFGRRPAPELDDTLCVMAGDPGVEPTGARAAFAQARAMVEQCLEAA
jgi:hypothetical protein